MSPRLLDVLVVAGWYPAVDDPAAGRFVADQAEALARSGRTRIAVASAERVQLSGGLSLRTEEESAFRRLARTASAGAKRCAGFCFVVVLLVIVSG